MHETAATPSVSLAAVEIVSLAAVLCVCVFKNYVFRQAKVYRIRFADLTLKPRLAEHTDTQTASFFFLACSN